MEVSMLSKSCILLLAVGGALAAATYEVGPGKQYAAIGDVHWESLEPGDLVLIHWRPTPYKEKWVLCRQGTAGSPITVRGVPGSGGELPVIDGNGATTRTALNYWNEDRGLLKIGGASTPPDLMPRYLVIEKLDLRSARPPYSFTSDTGAAGAYRENAAAIYIEKGEHIIIRDCVLHDSGNGLFLGSPATQPSRDMLIEGNYIYDNGNAGSAYEHNNYSAAIGIVFQHNHFGPTRAGTSGNNLKDRSAGLVVRYNWIEGGNRQLDLVDAEDSSLIAADPSYRATFVYGNILIEPDGAGNRQIVHYGGDSGNTDQYRKGTLHMYNNTIVSTRTDRTTIFRLSSNSETADFRNNVVYVTAGGDTLSLVDQSGILNLSHNWFQPGKAATFGTLTGAINDDATSIIGPSPGFLDEAGQDFHLSATSPARDGGTPLHPAVLPNHPLQLHYRKHQSVETRPADTMLDIGGFEYAASSSGCDLNADSQVNVADAQLLVNIVNETDPRVGDRGDLNSDGDVNEQDLPLLYEVIFGNIACPE
jgi:hypothetical protein